MGAQVDQKLRGMSAINRILSDYAGQPATLAELMACMKTSATLRNVWRQVRAEMGTTPAPAPLQQLQEQQQQQLTEQRPPSPHPVPRKWGTGDYGEGTWGGTTGPEPAKAPMPDASKKTQ